MINMMQIITFTKVALPFGFLSNMSPYPITINGEIWRTAESLFQALRFDDADIQQSIRNQVSPMGAKMVAKYHKSKMIIAPRSIEDLENMRIVLKLKLQQHQELRTELLATGDAQLIEDCTKRANESGLFWGAAFVNGKWIGENHLGKHWMSIRDETG